jgi:Leucine-rich repeat (LRR) protein
MNFFVCRQNWNTEEPVHSWYKVGTLGGHVHSIVMSSNGMSGRLPASIIGLTHLRMIELATMTGLTGSLPEELCRLTALKRLCICRCAVRGSIPARIGDLIALEELQLFGNQLSGIIPSSLSKLTSLRLLSLGEYTGGNSFSPATLPDAISCLTQLEALFMANCSLKGSLPSWIGCLTELRQLDLQRNQMSGVLPASLGNCTNLLYLNLKDNTGLCGLLPISSLARLTRLNRLSLVHCSFSNTDAAAAQLEILLPRCKLWI